MTLYLTASTPVRKVFIDFIEVLLCDGRVVSLNWDESGIDWTEMCIRDSPYPPAWENRIQDRTCRQPQRRTYISSFLP